MTKEQLDALFELKREFPNASIRVDESNVLKIEAWLTAGQAKFWQDAQQLMARREQS